MIEKGSIRFGIAGQTGLGTLAANPTYLFGVADGDLPPQPVWNTDELTSGAATPTGRALSRVEVPFNFTTRAYPGSIGTILKHALGTAATSGTGPYTHIFNHVRPLPYLSIFKEIVTPVAHQAARDGKITSLRLEWEENAPVRVIVNGVATVFSKPSSVTAGTDETAATTYLTPVGGTFTLDVDSATPVTVPVKGGFIEVTNAAEAEFFSGNLAAGSTSDNIHEASCGFTVKPTDLTDWNAMVDAALAGTDLYGSFAITFVKGAVSLKAESGKVGFVPYAIPAEAGGKALEAELGGACFPASGWDGPVKFTLVNEVETY